MSFSKSFPRTDNKTTYPVWEEINLDSENENKGSSENLPNNENEDEFNPTLAAMESEIKPKVLKTANIML